MYKSVSLFHTLLLLVACGTPLQPNNAKAPKIEKTIINNSSQSLFDTTVTTVHVFVALCDNRYQGIVPVPAAIGNGQDPNSNLYWGCGYGIRTYFRNSQQ